MGDTPAEDLSISIKPPVIPDAKASAGMSAAISNARARGQVDDGIGDVRFGGDALLQVAGASEESGTGSNPVIKDIYIDTDKTLDKYDVIILTEDRPVAYSFTDKAGTSVTGLPDGYEGLQYKMTLDDHGQTKEEAVDFDEAAMVEAVFISNAADSISLGYWMVAAGPEAPSHILDMAGAFVHVSNPVHWKGVLLAQNGGKATFKGTVNGYAAEKKVNVHRVEAWSGEITLAVDFGSYGFIGEDQTVTFDGSKSSDSPVNRGDGMISGSIEAEIFGETEMLTIEKLDFKEVDKEYFSADLMGGGYEGKVTGMFAGGQDEAVGSIPVTTADQKEVYHTTTMDDDTTVEDETVIEPVVEEIYRPDIVVGTVSAVNEDKGINLIGSYFGENGEKSSESGSMGE